MTLIKFLLCFVGAAIGSAAYGQQADGSAQKAESEVDKHHFVQINGIKMHYVTEGEGQTILFLHGFPEFWYEWKNQLAEFGKRYQAVAPDMRGYNLSEKPAKVEDYALPLLVADVKALLDKISPGRKAILVAHDWGGAVAWVFAAEHPEYLEKLVIINAPHPAVFTRELQSNPAQQKASSYMTFFRSAQAESILSAGHNAALAAAVFGASSRPEAFSATDRSAYQEAWSQPGAITGGLNYYRAARLGPPAKRDAGKEETGGALAALPSTIVSVPTLVIWGDKDTALLQGNLEGLDKYVSHLTIKHIPEGTHWVIHEESHQVNRLIQEFLDR